MADDTLVLDPARFYILLGGNGESTVMIGGDEFWSHPPEALDRLADGWLVSEYVFSSSWPTWEMHPNADEVVYLLQGAAELLLERPDRIETVALNGRGAVVVPRGVWHTARTSQICRMLHITMGRGTQTRPSAEVATQRAG